MSAEGEMMDPKAEGRCQEILRRMEAMACPRNSEGMARYGIRSTRVLGLSMGTLSDLAKEIGKDHAMAGCLWDDGSQESRLLAALVEDPREVTDLQMDLWAEGFDNWAICDGVSMHLFRRTPFAKAKCLEWSSNEKEYVKRAAFTLMASLAVHDRKAGDEVFLEYLRVCERECEDDRDHVKKGVSWALRQIGKRNICLNQAAIETSVLISRHNSRAARWISSEALRELRGEKVQARLVSREGIRGGPRSG